MCRKVFANTHVSVLDSRNTWFRKFFSSSQKSCMFGPPSHPGYTKYNYRVDWSSSFTQNNSFHLVDTCSSLPCQHRASDFVSLDILWNKIMQYEIYFGPLNLFNNVKKKKIFFFNHPWLFCINIWKSSADSVPLKKNLAVKTMANKFLLFTVGIPVVWATFDKWLCAWKKRKLNKTVAWYIQTG